MFAGEIDWAECLLGSTPQSVPRPEVDREGDEGEHETDDPAQAGHPVRRLGGLAGPSREYGEQPYPTSDQRKGEGHRVGIHSLTAGAIA